MKFDALCEFVEEELSEIKKRVMQAGACRRCVVCTILR
jgi:hypothetical protein